MCLVKFGVSTLAEELAAGLDPHLVIASEILRLPYEQCHKKRHYFERQCGKVLNFGGMGGMGGARLEFAAKNQYGVNIDGRGKELKDLWWAKRPEMRLYSNHIDEIVSSGMLLEQLYSGRFRGGCTYTEGCNTLFQGLASEIFKTAGFLVAKACYIETASPLFGCRIVNGIHDEFILEVPIGREHEAAEELTRIMLVAAAMWLKKAPQPKIEADAMMRWSKKVRAVKVEGRLVPWVRNIDDDRCIALVDGREYEIAA